MLFFLIFLLLISAFLMTKLTLFIPFFEFIFVFFILANFFQYILRNYCFFGHRLIIFKIKYILIYFTIFRFQFQFISTHISKSVLKFFFCIFYTTCIIDTGLVVFDTKLHNWKLLKLFKFLFFYVSNSNKLDII